MDMQQLAPWLVWIALIAGLVASICEITKSFASLSGTILRNTTKVCITGIACLAGAFLALKVIGFLSSITPNQPFACVMGAIACKSTNPFYIWGEMLIIGVFMLVGGGFSGWGAWFLIKRFW